MHLLFASPWVDPGDTLEEPTGTQGGDGTVLFFNCSCFQKNERYLLAKCFTVDCLESLQ